MKSLILRTTSRLLLTLQLLFSFFLLLRGHNYPGGGFSGGLVAATAWALYSIAYGAPATRKAIRADPRDLIGSGFILGIASGLASLMLGKPMMTGLWAAIQIDPLETFKLGTPLLFDVGVYLVVFGVVLTIILALGEEK